MEYTVPGNPPGEKGQTFQPGLFPVKIRLPAPLLRREQRAEGGAPCKEIKENQTGMLGVLSYKRHKDCCLIGLR
jgi:hypothetical protein